MFPSVLLSIISAAKYQIPKTERGTGVVCITLIGDGVLLTAYGSVLLGDTLGTLAGPPAVKARSARYTGS